MTDLIDRYLAALGRELPDAQRADIVAELRDELLSQIETREAAVGRPLERAELEAELIDFGNPLVVAGRYRRTQHLIGPEMFPFWWAGLKASLMIVAVVYLVLTVLVVVGGRLDLPDAAEGVSSSLVGALVWTFAVVTVVCALVERFGKPGAFARWKPSALPPAQGRTRGRFEIMVEAGMGLVVLAWWTGLIHFRNVVPTLELRVDLAPVWAAWYWPIFGYLAGEFVMNLLALARPAWVRLNGALFIVRNLVGATILSFVYQADHIVVVTGDTLRPEVLAEIQANFDRGFQIGIAATILILLWLAAHQAWRLRQFLRLTAGPASRAV